jgi:hypothetical protein
MLTFASGDRPVAAAFKQKTKEFCRKAFELKVPEAHEVLIFTKACEAHDRAEQSATDPEKRGADV